MAESDGCTLWYPHKPEDLYLGFQGVLNDKALRDLIAKEEDNQRAVEDVINNTACGGECSCYVEHREVTQTIDPPLGGVGERAERVQIDWDAGTTNTCGTLDNEDAMLVLHLNWFWQGSAADPYISDITGSGLATVSARGVFVYSESGLLDPPVAFDTRLGIGTSWLDGDSDNADAGSISVPLNLFPAGQGFEVWVAQNSGDFLDITLRADLYTVCGCACVL